MKIIDFHTHIYPEKIAEKAVVSIGDFYNIEMSGQGTSKALIEGGRECGITNYVVHSVAVTANTVEAINDFISAELKEHDEFYGFGTMHADYDEKIKEAIRLTGLGLKGIKIHPDTQKFNLDDERMFELYDYMQGEKLPLLIHTGDYRYDYSHPRRLKKLLKEFPKLITIGAHFGGWSVYDLAYEFLKDENCYVDTSSSFFMLGKERAKELIRLYGAERVLFGTDFPMWDAKGELDMLYDMKLTDDEYNLIFHENAEKLLKMKKEV